MLSLYTLGLLIGVTDILERTMTVDVLNRSIPIELRQGCLDGEAWFFGWTCDDWVLEH